MRSTSNLLLDDEWSGSRTSNHSYERRAGHQHSPFHCSGPRHHTAGRGRNANQASDHGYPGCGRVYPNSYSPDDDFEDDHHLADYVAPLSRSHARSQARDKKWKLVWPRDQNPRHGNWGPWDRIKDLATGKGPDIWIEELHRNGPHHPSWTGWKTEGPQHPADPRPRWGNLGIDFRDDEHVSLIKSARREDGKRYDHLTRSYRMPQPYTWSDVVWDDVESDIPLYTRDGYGSAWVNPKVPRGRAYNLGTGPNPFWGRLP